MRQRHWVISLLLIVTGLSGSLLAEGEAVQNSAEAYEQARAVLHAADFDAAERLFGNLVERFPDNADFLLGLGQAYLAANHVDRAIGVLEQARQLAPHYIDVLQVLASAYAAGGYHQAAELIRADAAQWAPDVAWLNASASSNEVLAQHGRLTVGFTTEATRTERNDTWHESAFSAEYAWSRTKVAGFRAARSQRFGEHDSLYEVFGSLPLTSRVMIAGRGLFSPSHQVRHKSGALVEISAALSKGWVVTVGGGRTRYNSGPSDKGTLTLERYFGSYRLAYTAMAVQPQGGPWSPVHRLGGSWYYGVDNRLNFNLATGEETDESVTGAASLKFDTWGAGLGGRHWFTPRFAVDYSAGYEGLESSRGDHLDRTTFYAGIVFRL